MKKKIFSLALVVCFMAVLTFSGTMAYFTAENVAHNVITSSKVDIHLNEITLKVDPETGEQVTIPGDPVEKSFERTIEFVKE